MGQWMEEGQRRGLAQNHSETMAIIIVIPRIIITKFGNIKNKQ
jgi:hypothetical protein